MDCRIFRELIYPYLDSELWKEAKEMVKTHLDSCQSCAESLEQKKKVVNILGSLERLSAPVDFAEQVLSKIEVVEPKGLGYPMHLLGMAYFWRGFYQSFRFLKFLGR